jgi:hypothetical protein
MFPTAQTVRSDGLILKQLTQWDLSPAQWKTAMPKPNPGTRARSKAKCPLMTRSWTLHALTTPLADIEARAAALGTPPARGDVLMCPPLALTNVVEHAERRQQFREIGAMVGAKAGSAERDGLPNITCPSEGLTQC